MSNEGCEKSKTDHAGRVGSVNSEDITTTVPKTVDSNSRIFQELSSFRMPHGFRGRSAWFVQLWWLVQATLFRWSPQIVYGWRKFLLRAFGAKVGKKVIIRPSVTVTYPWKVTIGDNAWIGDDVILYSLGEISIGANTAISQKTYICTGGHDYKKVNFPIFSKPVIIEDEVWIATDVYVAPGVRIGKGAVVGARSSVFKDIEGGYVYVGSPATKIRKRSSEKS